MVQTSVDPRLPPELERTIFESAAFLHPTRNPEAHPHALLRVEPVLCQVVIVCRQDYPTSQTIQAQWMPVSDGFGIKIVGPTFEFLMFSNLHPLSAAAVCSSVILSLTLRRPICFTVSKTT